jgi:hypothetical protein
VKKPERPTKASRQYAKAYAVQYTSRDLHAALKLHRGIMAAYPDSIEAGYSRMQIINIVTDIVPRQELLNAQAELALAHLEFEEATCDGARRDHTPRDKGKQ